MSYQITDKLGNEKILVDIENNRIVYKDTVTSNEYYELMNYLLNEDLLIGDFIEETFKDDKCRTAIKNWEPSLVFDYFKDEYKVDGTNEIELPLDTFISRESYMIDIHSPYGDAKDELSENELWQAFNEKRFWGAA